MPFSEIPASTFYNLPPKPYVWPRGSSTHTGAFDEHPGPSPLPKLPPIDPSLTRSHSWGLNVLPPLQHAVGGHVDTSTVSQGDVTTPQDARVQETPREDAAPHGPSSLGDKAVASPSTPHATNDSKRTKTREESGRKSREEFTLRDVEKLLSAVLEINPYMCPRNKSQEKWKEVHARVQAVGACEGRDWETVRNKVGSLLKWVEGGKKQSNRSPMVREFEKDPAGFAVVSGRLDSVQALRDHAAQTKEAHREQAKEAADKKSAAGELLREAMLKGHARKRDVDVLSESEEADGADKENEESKRSSSRESSVRPNVRRRREDGVARLVGFMEEQNAVQRQLLDMQSKTNERLEEAQRRANEESRLLREESRLAREEGRLARESQERTAQALLEILRAGLLG